MQQAILKAMLAKQNSTPTTNKNENKKPENKYK
jgi:hypothetical protein